MQNGLKCNERRRIWADRTFKIENQIIQTFYKIGSPLQIRPPLFNLQKFEDSEKSRPGSCRMD